MAPGDIQAKRIVIKIGSSTLTDAHGRIDASYIADVARQVHELHDNDVQVLIVTSAAIVAGLGALGFSAKRPDDIPTLQAAAAVGQLELVKVYEQAFAAYGIRVGQVLLTRFDTANRESYLHARDTLERLLELEAVPIINENDTVAVDEICFGDNDTLAALVAILVKADLVVLLSDIEGLYTADPRTDEDAYLLEHVGTFTDEIIRSAGGSGSVSGSGGMATKVEAARVLMAADIPMVICEGHQSDVICEAVCGKQVGTRFSSDENGRHTHARKLWIALGGSVKGTVYIDDGAVHALRENGGSLLPVGVRKSEGDFDAGAAVDIRDLQGALVGRGVVDYSSDELAVVAGRKTSEIARNALLAHLADRVVVHRDQLIVF